MDVKVLRNSKEFACLSYITGDIMIDAGEVPDKPIKKLILTHCHFDHVLYANAIKEKFGAKIYSSKKCAEHLECMDEVVNVFLEPFGKKLSKIKVDVILKEGDRVGDFKVLETPGHTDGSICLFNEKEKIMFTGDTLFHQGFGRTDLPTGDEEELFKSLERVKKINLSLIYPGH